MKVLKQEKCETHAEISPHQLRSYCYFSCLSDEALREIAAKLQEVKFPAGEKIISEGASGDSFYFVHKGEVDIFKKTPAGQEAFLSTLGGGEVFGEMALLTSSPRTATVVARTDVSLLRLLKSDFESAVLADAMVTGRLKKRANGYAYYNQLKVLEPFAPLEPARMMSLFIKTEERKYSPGDTIIAQGDAGDVYYIIQSGRVAVMKQMLEETQEKVAELGAGMGFGEEALLTGAPRSASVQAVEETVVLAVTKADFDGMLKASFLEEVSFDDIIFDEEERPVFLDVRTQAEFEEEHLPNAVNIPLDELRQRYEDFDRDREYYVHCITGDRSAVATFLLNMHGLRAKNIKGGLAEWKGPVVGNGEGIHQPMKPT
jgi:CRP-like cAMP-binding protein